MSAKEAEARIKINKLLEEAGWRFFEENGKPANIQVEPNVKITKKQVDKMGKNFDKVENGFVDFLLLDDNGHPFIVLEAKSEDKDPLVGKEQARKYAKSLYIKYVILSNGNQHYFWDIYRGNPQIITSFPDCESIRENKAFNADPAKLYNEEIREDYIAVVKNARYAEAPEYQNLETRDKFLFDNGLKFLRPYQMNAIKALQRSVKDGNQRFLFEMATGERVIIVMGAVCAIKSRVSGTLNKYISCIA
ncbi:MAG TPA: type I restriction enzyme HsdR N-terminal domain-containing protein [Clostridia bacterium]|nr:type I restriction enzyme HsdR N-terminal domain-containing protein [Clostridia bacterium]